MKKITLTLTVIVSCLLLTSKANAGFVKGSFSADETLDDGVFLIGCDDVGGSCGLLVHGLIHDYFEAADGSEWTLMDAKGGDDIQNGIQVRATEGEDK
jgi:hypothetical protein